MESIDPGNACAAFGEDDLVELLAIAEFHEDAGSVLMNLAKQAGKQADSIIEWLPDDWEAKLQGDARSGAAPELCFRVPHQQVQPSRARRHAAGEE
ncbi:hypothetical protein [Sphingomonas sp. J315]|uniref:hypothetical protein n=1 Tax=Sphingomonas sp. J315 TaxID=2898433 RepID=UPI0021ADA56C|nr:hypothetical protein [Sphingomonas sp. J315]UUY01290.1 hypothetical protein LRS08_09810 [Sphingomonas sp. J315]